MTTQAKPAGYSSVSPYLMVKDARQVIDFLQKAFGASEIRRMLNPDGSVMHAEVRIDDTVIMLADGAEGFPAFPSWLHVYVADADQVYQRAVQAGGVPVQEPTVMEGDTERRGGVEDPSGNIWWMATPVEQAA